MSAAGPAFVALDLGATSGRVVVGSLAAGGLVTHEVHRFPALTTGTGAGRCWDVDGLLTQTLLGLRRAGEHPAGHRVAAIGVTAWGVDVGVLDGDDRLVGPVPHYRSADPADAAALLDRVPAAELFECTGVLPQPMNTVFRLRRTVDAAVALRGSADGLTVLAVPDLWCTLLTGDRAAERSIAGTTGLLSRHTGTWDDALLGLVGVDRAVLPPVTAAGQVVAPLRRTVRGLGVPGGLGALADLGALAGRPFVRVAHHDTASAVLAVGGRPRTAFIQCGTWSLVGVERDEPLPTPAALAAGFTNEAGWGRGWLLMRNLTGLWLLEEALRAWRAAGLDLAVPELLAQADAVGPLSVAVDVGAAELVGADDVLGALHRLCVAAGTAAPTSPAEVARCIVQSLALAHARGVAACEALTGEPVEQVRMTGGGSRGALLRRLTADACGRPLLAGPAEATALGSIAAQALAVGAVAGLDEARTLVGSGVDVVTVHPSTDPATARWWQRLDALVPRSLS